MSGAVTRILACALAVAAFAAGQNPRFIPLGEDFADPRGALLGHADLDGDGDRDLVTVRGTWRNDGAGGFTLAAVAPTGIIWPWPADPAVFGDLDGDGDDDAVSVIPFYVSSPVAVWMSPGNGTLVPGAPAPPVPVPPSSGGSGCVSIVVDDLALGDVDGDGDPDIVVTSRDSCVLNGTGWLRLWLNDGTGAFIDASPQLPPLLFPSAFVLLLDADGDQDQDILVAPRYGGGAALRTLLLNSGGGTFTTVPTTVGTGLASWSVAVVELNQDGRPDFAFSCGLGGPVIEVLLSTPSGFTPPVVLPRIWAAWPVAFLDLDADGDDDEVRSGPSATAWLSGPSGPFSQRVDGVATFTVPARSHVSPPDLDGDGDLDLVGTWNGLVRTAFNDGSPGFVERPRPLPAWTYLGRLAQADDDGVADVVFRVGTSGRLFARNDGNGFFSAPDPDTVRWNPSDLTTFSAIIDWDGDGDDDVLSLPDVWIFGAEVSRWRNAGGVLRYAGAGPFVSYVAAAAAGDLDGDGDQDLVLGRFAPSNNAVPLPAQILWNLGGGSFSAPVPLGPAHVTREVLVRDVDADGDLDVLQVNEGSSPVAGMDNSVLHLNDGSGGFTAAPGFPAAQGQGGAAADFDGDGSVDFVIGTTLILRTGGAWTAWGSFGAWSPGKWASGDVDEDGDPDLVSESGVWTANLGGGAFGPPERFSAAAPFPTGIGPELADLDRDGDLDLLFLGSAVHVNTTRQLTPGVLPVPGRATSIGILGPPSTPALLFVATGPAVVPAPPYGTLLLEPATAGLFASLVLPPTGRLSVPLAVPGAPSLAGLSLFWQSLLVAPQRFSNLLVTTVVAF